MEKINVTERDIRLIQLLSRCGVMRPGQAKIAYGDVSRYHLRRVEKLVSFGLLMRDSGYIRVTAKGLRAAGITERPLRLEKHRYREHEIIINLLTEFPDWEFTFAIDLKRRETVQNSSKLGAVIRKDTLRYGIYVLTNRPRPATVVFLRSEMADLRNSGIERLLVFCTAPEIMRAFGDDTPDGIREFCLLPYPEGVQSFRQLFTPEFKAFINARFPGLTPSRRPFAHFEWRDAFITVLVHNDLVKKRYLQEYLEHAQKREGKRCIVVCSPDQSFPGAHKTVICRAQKGDSAACLSQA